MARRPRNQPINQPSVQSAEITRKDIIRYEPKNFRLKMIIGIDGKDVKKTARNVRTDDPAEHQKILDDTAESMRVGKNDAVARRGSDEVRHGDGDWSSLPEGPDKQRIAQQAMRDVAEFAREGKELQAQGRTRPDAFQRYANTRNLKASIWDKITLDHPEKAEYLALSREIRQGETDHEYGALRKYMSDLENAAPDWAAVVVFMDTCANPIEIETEMTV